MARTRFAALIAMLALALPLRAQESKDAALDEARKHNAKAKMHYDLGEYEQAANEYIIVYRLRPIPAVLYNVAQAYRQAGMYEKARQFYKSYLRENPEPKVRAAIEKALKEIDELLAKDKKTRESRPTGVATDAVPAAPPPLPMAAEKQEKPPAQPPISGQAVAEKTSEAAVKPPPGQTVAVATPPKPGVTPKPAPAVAVKPVASQTVEKKEGKSHTAAWVLAGTSVALLGGGGLFFAKASSTDSSLQNAPHSRAEADQLISQSNSNHKLSAVLLGAGAAAAVTAVILFIVQ
jgi:tetratricopeptide (TPR) repeat protein